jgi:hypothetical protein
MCCLQVQGYQAQLAALHLRVDNLLLERHRLQEEAAEAAAQQQQQAAAVAAPRPRASRGQPEELDTANADCEGGSVALAADRASWQSEGSSGRAVAELASEEVTWGRTLTGRRPAPRPQSVPPVNLARLRPPLIRG